MKAKTQLIMRRINANGYTVLVLTASIDGYSQVSLVIKRIKNGLYSIGCEKPIIYDNLVEFLDLNSIYTVDYK